MKVRSDVLQSVVMLATMPLIVSGGVMAFNMAAARSAGNPHWRVVDPDTLHFFKVTATIFMVSLAALLAGMKRYLPLDTTKDLFVEPKSGTVVVLACGGEIALGAVPKDADPVVCSKGCSHTSEEVVDAMLEGLERRPGLTSKVPLAAYFPLLALGLGLRSQNGEFTFLGATLGRYELLHRDWTGAEILTIAALLWLLYLHFGGPLPRRK